MALNYSCLLYTSQEIHGTTSFRQQHTRGVWECDHREYDPRNRIQEIKDDVRL